MIPRLLIISLATVLLAGCFSRAPRSVTAERRSSSLDARGALEGRDIAAPAEGAVRSVPPVDYRLAPRDQVVFEMFNEPDVKTTQRLSSQGEMTLPLTGTVTLAGMTLREAEQEIRRRYKEGGYYVDPQVILSVAEYGERYVTVLGQVNRPDRIAMPIETATISLVDAVTQAGGFTRLARTDAVRVTRPSGDGGERNIIIDVRDFLGHRAKEDFQLQPGDVVFVPERVF